MAEERKGLFSRIGTGIKKFAKSGVGQAIGHVGAFAVNPVLGVGLLAARGEFGPGGARERKALENDEARERVRSARGTNDAQDELQGLLSRTGPTVTGTNATPAFQLEGIDGFAPGTPGAGATPVHNIERGLDEIDTQGGQAKAEGLLSRIAPQQFASAEFGTTRSNTTRLKIEALREEAERQGLVGDAANQFVNDNLKTAGSPLAEAIAAANLAATTQRTSDAEREANTEISEADDAAAVYEGQMRSTATNLLELIDVNDSLFNGAGLTKPGLPAAGLRRDLASIGGPIAGAAGFDELGGSLNQGTADTDRFGSLAGAIAIDRIDTTGFDAGSVAKFSMFTSNKPSVEMVGPANDANISSNLKGLLIADDHKKIYSKMERQAIEDAIKKLDSRTTNDAPVPAEDNSAVSPEERALFSLREQAGGSAVDLTQPGGTALDSFNVAAERVMSSGLETVSSVKDQIAEAAPSPEEMVQFGQQGLKDLDGYIAALKVPEVNVPDKAALLRRAEEARKFLQLQVEAAAANVQTVIDFAELPTGNQ